MRSRECKYGQAGDGCLGDTEDTQVCNSQECPFWTEWPDYGSCSETCGSGNRVQNRTCTFGVAGVDCVGDSYDDDVCNTQECPVWST